MKAFATVLAVALVANAGVALAGAPLNPPRVYTGVYQPKGAPTKPTSFAPRAGNKRHAYGAPIQSPILKRQQARSPKSSAAQLPRRP